MPFYNCGNSNFITDMYCVHSASVIVVPFTVPQTRKEEFVLLK